MKKNSYFFFADVKFEFNNWEFFKVKYDTLRTSIFFDNIQSDIFDFSVLKIFTPHSGLASGKTCT